MAKQARAIRLETLESIKREHYPEDATEMPRWKQLIYLTLQWGLARERAWLQWAEESEKFLLTRDMKGDPQRR